MKASKTYNITPSLRLLDLSPPIAGHEKFIGAYLFCGERNAIVDTGPKTAIPNLISTLAELSINPAEIDYVILTHIHIDHAGGVGTALKRMNRAKVVAHSRAQSHLIDPTLLWKSSLKTLGELAIEYGDIEPVPEDRILVARDSMKLDLGRDLKLELYLTPGHAPHHLSLFDRANGVLIAGEAAGVCVDGIIRLATPPPFRLEETLSSINRLIALKPEKICYGHFGCYDNALKKLTVVRQRLLAWYKIVTSAAKAGKNSEDILVALRERDSSLDYLNKLGEAEYSRELAFLINSIEGLSGAVRK